MQELANDMILYHGSYCEVREPDLRQCARYKDFGRGFYVTTSRKQARSFAQISIRRAIANGIANEDQNYGIVSSFRFCLDEKLSVKIYAKADAEWLHCIVGHRKMKAFSEIVRELREFDIIAGKIANDNTNATITTYMAGVFGIVGTRSADDLCIGLLLPDRLQDQFCFRTSKALNSLTFVESEQVWI